MLNAERVILMTRLASYETGEGKQNMAIGKYFRSDYIRLQTIKSVVYATIAFFMRLLSLNNLSIVFILPPRPFRPSAHTVSRCTRQANTF